MGPAQALGVTNTLAGHEDSFEANRVVLTASDVGSPQCDAPRTVMSDNQYFTPDGNLTECGKSLANNQKASGMDLRSTVATIPDDDTIIGWARDMLGF